jgi:hypothetical protein
VPKHFNKEIKMERKWSKKRLTPIVMGACVLALASCGKVNHGPSDSGGGVQQQQAQPIEGTYHADLTVLNSKVAGNPTGTADISIQGDNVVVKVMMNGTPMNITHVQHIHTASACPPASADVNKDTYIDVVEGLPFYGPILIPLDGDLSSQAAGSTIFPMADASGSYTYNQSTSLARMLADLHAPDLDLTDAIVKLAPGEDLNLAGRHVIIHGVPASTNLPSTVATLHGLPNYATLPIACGPITRVTTTGGTATGGTATGGTATGGTATGGTATGGTATGGTATGGTATGGTSTGGTSTGGTSTGGTTGM